MSAYTGGIERLEAILAEAGQRMQYPPTPDFASAVLERVDVARAKPPRRLPRLWPVTARARLVLIIALALLLLACAAGVTYVVTQTTWLRSAPRGVQFTDDFSLVELFRDPHGTGTPPPDQEGYVEVVSYRAMQLGPDGREIYAIQRHNLYPPGDPRNLPVIFQDHKTAMVRLTGLEEEQARVEELFKFPDLKDPALWDPGVGPIGSVQPTQAMVNYRNVSVAGNGDLFFVANALTQAREQVVDPIDGHISEREPVPLSTSVIVRHRDGTSEKVVTIKELVGLGLLEPAFEDHRRGVTIAASSPHRVWVHMLNFRPIDTDVFRRFFQIRDPNGDGDWSDRIVLPLALPAEVGPIDYPPGRAPRWYYSHLMAEPSTPGADRSASFLLGVFNRIDGVRVYRVSDANADGDAQDAGEFLLIYSAKPKELGDRDMAPRVVVEDGEVVLRELVVSGLTTGSRVSRLSGSGEVTDVARAFSWIDSVLADRRGNIYVWALPPDQGKTTLYKLKPVPVGAEAQAYSVIPGSALAAEPAPTAQKAASAPGPGLTPTILAAATQPETSAAEATPGVPLIAFAREEWEPEGKGEILVIAADGTGLRKLLEGERYEGFTRCAETDRLAYYSDEEVPNEP